MMVPCSFQGHNRFAMYVIVPNSLAGLPKVLAEVDNLRPDLDAMQERTVDVTMPKFQFDYTSQLDGLLKEVKRNASSMN
jgi:serine protease inhibitor